jgi:hypothetical protein
LGDRILPALLTLDLLPLISLHAELFFVAVVLSHLIDQLELQSLDVLSPLLSFLGKGELGWLWCATKQ